MRRQAVVTEPVGLRRHDHVAVMGDGPGALDALARTVFGDSTGERLMFVADDPSPTRLAGLPGLEQLLATGMLQLAKTAEVYGSWDEFDAEAQLAVFTDALDTALAEGFTGLRVVADNTPLAESGDLSRWLAWEQLTDRFQDQREVIGVCFFDRTRLGHARVQELLAVHPLVITTDIPLFRVFADGDALRIVGEIDNLSRDRLERLLATTPRSDEVLLDLAECSFIDHQTVLALAAHAGDTRSVVIRNAQPSVRLLWDLIGRPNERVRFA
jgi:anti-anti-sigma regulatory factor